MHSSNKNQIIITKATCFLASALGKIGRIAPNSVSSPNETALKASWPVLVLFRAFSPHLQLEGCKPGLDRRESLLERAGYPCASGLELCQLQ